MDVSDAQRLKTLEDESGKLKRLLADAMLDNIVLKDLLESPDDTERAAGGSAQGDAGSRHLAAPGLRSGWCRSEDGAARAPVRQPGNPQGHAGDRGCAAPVRLSADRSAAGAQGHADEPEEAVSALSRGRAVRSVQTGPQARPRQQNAFIESFNGSLRDELLNEEIFDTLDDARRKIALWRYDYNAVRPHSSLGNRTPLEARRTLALNDTQNYQSQTGRLSL